MIECDRSWQVCAGFLGFTMGLMTVDAHLQIQIRTTKAG